MCILQGVKIKILWWICKLIRWKHQQNSRGLIKVFQIFTSVDDMHMVGLWLAFTGKHKIQKHGEYK